MKKRPDWMVWVLTIALVFVGILGAIGVMGIPHFFRSDDIAYGFALTEEKTVYYYPLDREARLDYGLEDMDADQLTKKDLGEPMGTVYSCGDKSLIGCKVYHYAKYPDLDSICIVKLRWGHAIYTADYLNLDTFVGQSSDALLDAYGLPESLQKMEVFSEANEYLFIIEDAETCDRIFELLAGRKNIGYGEYRRWMIREGHHADGGEETAQTEQLSDDESLQLAYESSSRGMRILDIVTKRGFRCRIDYHPAIAMFFWGDGYFRLPAEDAAELNGLLQIE